MLTYALTTAYAVLFAALAGSRVVTAGQEDSVAPPRRGPAFFWAVCVVVVLAGVAALRYRMGVDYGQYERMYLLGYLELTRTDISFGSESGFDALASLAGRIYDDPATMFALASALTVGLMVGTYARFAASFPLAVFLFVMVGLWHGSFNGVRQFLAVAIIVAAHNLLLGRRRMAFAVAVALASTFHVSAWVMLPLALLPQRRLSLGRVGLVLVLAVLAVAGYEAVGAALDAVNEDEILGSNYFETRVNPLRVGFAFVPYAIYALFSEKERCSPRTHLYANLALIHGAVSLAAFESAYIARFTLYTAAFIPLALPAILATTGVATKRAVTLGCCLVYGLFWYVEVTTAATLLPFRWLTERSA